MNIHGIRLGWVITGAFYSVKSITKKMQDIINMGTEIFPIMSFNAYNVNTRYGKAKELITNIERVTSNKIINTFVEAEKIGKKNNIDILIIAPCTGNTLAKLANGIIDTPALVAVKSILKNQKNVVIGIDTNDGLSTNAINIGKLLNTKNIYFVPFRQNNPITKPFALMYDINEMIKTVELALDNEQKQPLLL